MKKFCEFSWVKIFAIFAFLSFAVRSVFLFLERKEIVFSTLLVLKIYVVGLFFDLLALSYIATLPLFYYTFIPNKILNSKIHQIANRFFYFLFLYVIVFSCFSEWFFWEEFQSRFNFIAVDYLIYTTEVIGNIMESYPMHKLVSAIFIITTAIFFFTHKKIVIKKTDSALKKTKIFAGFIVVLSAAFFAIDSSKLTNISENKYANEIAANGIYQLFSAYRNNQIDYYKLYLSRDIKDALKELRRDISKQEPNSRFLNDDDISRFIAAPRSGGEKRYNVILVSIESFSAEFMEAFGNKEKIAPNMDKLAQEGLFFTNLKATGTRTVRGLEALSLSIPPTPGNSILRRPHNENMFNISSPLKERGYEAKFIYGGFGYFDNMNYFFENNGFEIVDRESFAKDEITFSNVWGVADEDLFNKALKEADKSHADGKPFLNFIMTTSNHRPFSYPNGKIDIDSKTGRNGAVKYTDYAIGKFVEEAKKKDWFKNTIFIFVADHCAGSAGNTDLPLWRYQIPAIFYAPEIIKPQIFNKNVSQIDIAPTLFGLMNLSYKSKFFGVDVLTNRKFLDEHAFVSTYLDVGYFEGHELYLLKPKKEVKIFDVTLEKYCWDGSKEILTKEYEKEELEEVISYYQAASYLFKNGKLKNFEPQQ
jgi:phosphoglycerol transferase MdoB-like AlkP superfamily enzyme